MAHESIRNKKKKRRKKQQQQQKKKKKFDEPDIAGITFCFHNKTARCINASTTGFKWYLHFDQLQQQQQKYQTHTHTLAAAENSYGNETTLLECLRSQQTWTNNASKEFFEWIRCIQICFRELVKHNKYRYISLSNYANHPKCDATSVYHKFAQIRKTTIKEKRNVCAENYMFPCNFWRADQRINFIVCYSISRKNEKEPNKILARNLCAYKPRTLLLLPLQI